MRQETIDSFTPFTPHYQIIKKGSLKEKIYGDAGRTEQVFTNLLSNAIKYSPNAKKLEVTISKKDGHVIVSVKDYGIGIPKAKQKDIFKRFFRVDDVTGKFSGLGIGLYISTEIIKRQGGKLWVESIEGNGSTFHFSLPLKKR